MEEIDIVEILKVLGIGTIIGILLNYFLLNSKLHKEEKSKIVSELTNNRIIAINKIRECLFELQYIESYDIINNTSKKFNIAKAEGTMYHSIFNDYRVLESFTKKVFEIREKYSNYVTDKIYLKLLILERYFLMLSKLTSNQSIKNKTKDIGVYLFYEIFIWIKQFNKDLVKLLNNPPFKY